MLSLPVLVALTSLPDSTLADTLLLLAGEILASSRVPPVILLPEFLSLELITSPLPPLFLPPSRFLIRVIPLVLSLVV